MGANPKIKKLANKVVSTCNYVCNTFIDAQQQKETDVFQHYRLSSAFLMFKTFNSANRTKLQRSLDLQRGTMQLLSLTDPNGNAVKLNRITPKRSYVTLVLNANSVLICTHCYEVLYTKEMKEEMSSFDESSSLWVEHPSFRTLYICFFVIFLLFF